MCLAVPGKIISIRQQPDESIGSAATVDFHGSRLDVSLLFTPEARTGDWVLVHAGFALNVLNEAEAMETWEYLKLAGADEVRTEMQGEPHA